MYTITMQKRDPALKAKQLRRFGIIPCVIYGAELKESLSVQMDQSTARQLSRTKRKGSKVCIQVDGTSYPTLIKELDYNVRNDEIVHVSFLILDSDKIVNSVADIVLINQDKVAGILEQMQMQIPHAAKPAHLLDTVTINLENMPVGTTLTIADIPEFSDNNIKLLTNSGNIVLRITEKK